MTLPDGFNLIHVALILVGLGIAWIVLKFLLRLTTRLFTCGCIALLALGAIAWLIIR
jgi:hypothetical protein